MCSRLPARRRCFRALGGRGVPYCTARHRRRASLTRRRAGTGCGCRPSPPYGKWPVEKRFVHHLLNRSGLISAAPSCPGRPRGGSRPGIVCRQTPGPQSGARRKRCGIFFFRVRARSISLTARSTRRNILKILLTLLKAIGIMGRLFSEKFDAPNGTRTDREQGGVGQLLIFSVGT